MRHLFGVQLAETGLFIRWVCMVTTRSCIFSHGNIRAAYNAPPYKIGTLFHADRSLGRVHLETVYWRWFHAPSFGTAGWMRHPQRYRGYRPGTSSLPAHWFNIKDEVQAAEVTLRYFCCPYLGDLPGGSRRFCFFCGWEVPHTVFLLLPEAIPDGTAACHRALPAFALEKENYFSEPDSDA